MHNLAVLYAEGIDGKPDYKVAAQWFRKAAGYGVADSQYNLAILYARGIGIRPEPGGILQVVRAGRRAGRQRRRQEARRGGGPARPASADGSASSRRRPSSPSASRTRRPASRRRRAAGTVRRPPPPSRSRSTSRVTDACVNGALNKRHGSRCYILRGHPRYRAYTGRVRVAAVGVTYFGPDNTILPDRRVQIYLPIADLPVNIFLVLGMGLAVGFISGMFGIGGGFLMTPLLIFIGISPAVAVASVASHIAASSCSGAISYWRRRAVDLALGADAAGRRHSRARRSASGCSPCCARSASSISPSAFPT